MNYTLSDQGLWMIEVARWTTTLYECHERAHYNGDVLPFFSWNRCYGELSIVVLGRDAVLAFVECERREAERWSAARIHM